MAKPTNQIVREALDRARLRKVLDVTRRRVAAEQAAEQRVAAAPQAGPFAQRVDERQRRGRGPQHAEAKDEPLTGPIPDLLREVLISFNAVVCGARDEGWTVTIGHAVDGLASLALMPPDADGLCVWIDPKPRAAK